MADKMRMTQPGKATVDADEAPKLTTPPDRSDAALDPGTRGTNAPKGHPFRFGTRYEDEGAVCERDAVPAGAACFLSPHQRSVTSDDLRQFVTNAIRNYQFALEHARVDVLLHKTKGWGIAGELLFSLASAVLLEGAGLAATNLAKMSVNALLEGEKDAIALRAAVAGVSAAQEAATVSRQIVTSNVGLVQSIVKQVSSTLKPGIKAKFDSFPVEVARKGEFIRELQNDATPLFMGIQHTIFETGDDATLVAAAAAFDTNLLTLKFYEAHVGALLERFDASRIADIGPRMQGPVRAGSTEAVELMACGQRRLAIIDFGEDKILGRGHGDEWRTDGNHYFVGWVDDDLEAAAMQAQYASFFHVKTLDVTGGHQLGRSEKVDQWVAQRAKAQIPAPHRLPWGLR